MTNSVPEPRWPLDDRTPPSKEMCWEEFWEIWSEGLIDAYERGDLS